MADDGFDPESSFYQEQALARDAAEAQQARLLAAAREGDGWCLGLAEATRLGHRCCTWVPVSGECPFTAQASADRFEAAFAARDEQQKRAARVAAADPATAPDDAIVARWIEGGDYAVRGKDSRRIAAWLDVPAPAAPAALAAINNPFAALAALRTKLDEDVAMGRQFSSRSAA